MQGGDDQDAKANITITCEESASPCAGLQVSNHADGADYRLHARQEEAQRKSNKAAWRSTLDTFCAAVEHVFRAELCSLEQRSRRSIRCAASNGSSDIAPRTPIRTSYSTTRPS
ncbi:hypothetical protein DIPPA_05454 [Diplonema papillatum]|nr:hypothetical protein DIPPA_05454 [Diplonema papillatum]